MLTVDSKGWTAAETANELRGSRPRCLSVPLWLMTLAMLTIAGWSSPCAAQVERIEDDIRSGRQLDLKQRLRYGLRARLKSDLLFIKKVTDSVDDGELPQSLVDSTFLWARRRALARRPKTSLRPMIYFRPAMVARAKLIGVTL